MIDLHCHSHFSDGKHSPQALVDKALASNIQTLALTDHDTVAGLKPLHEAASDYPLQIINGIELSTRWKKYDIHVIGLNIDFNCAELAKLINQQSDSRINRALQIAEKMQLFGVENAYEKACALAGHKRVGRPHFAQVLIDEGLVNDIQSAFKRFLARGRPAYIPTQWISVPEAVHGIIGAKGQAVLAHPLKYKLTRSKLLMLINEFKDAGGVAMEVVSGEMTATQIQEMAGLCMRYQLLASTGSDFHGDTLSRIPLGRQRQLPLNCMPVWDQWNS